MFKNYLKKVLFIEHQKNCHEMQRKLKTIFASFQKVLAITLKWFFKSIFEKKYQKYYINDYKIICWKKMLPPELLLHYKIRSLFLALLSGLTETFWSKFAKFSESNYCVHIKYARVDNGPT